ANLAFSVPARWLYRPGYTKRLLRDAVRPFVPSSVIARTEKVAFETPEAEWLTDSRAREYIGDLLLDPLARGRGLYDVRAIEADVKRASWSDTRGIWRALNLELWLRTVMSPS